MSIFAVSLFMGALFAVVVCGAFLLILKTGRDEE